MNKMTDQLIHLARLYADATGTKSLSGISTKIFNDGKTLDRVAAGGDLVTGSFEKALEWFDANWPAKEPWPKSIRRPVSKVAA